ncbi:Lon protease N-terminal domain-containing protein [Ferrimonas sediminum]|uniref:Lon protease N-terminal domain-containing protein n=1 Tax=Ferrimonas sediminum TaxID=718193 RepID=A0A1G8KNU0_9GAMM|nr:ATP-dependent protease [Ferrimonas sediminum]SDI45046.1 Lon protease N-terminal domain-containing protein [Ferrimonas sediminum]
MQRMIVALLPIDSPVLPQGRRELRMVTPGQSRVVAEHFRNQLPLVACVQREDGHPLPCYPIAAVVEILDFHLLDDGCLSVVVEGQRKFTVSQAWAEPDGVWMGQGFVMNNWPSLPMSPRFELLSEALLKLFDARPELGELYADKRLSDACWVGQRWLEILPLLEQDTQELLQSPDCQRTLNFILSLIIKPELYSFPSR